MVVVLTWVCLGLNSSQIQIFHMADDLYDHMASFGLVQLKDEWKNYNEVIIIIYIISQSLAKASLIFSNLGQ